MAIDLPPPPIRDPGISFAWADWYQKLHTFLGQTTVVLWATINTAGSALTDIATRDHSMLTAIQGNGPYHLSLAEQTKLTNIVYPAITSYTTSLPANPTTSDLASGAWGMFTNTTSGATRLWTNVGGTMKSVQLT